MRRLPIFLIASVPGAVARADDSSQADILGRLAAGPWPRGIGYLAKLGGVSFAADGQFLPHVKDAGGG
jgi:hypothetical protein